MATEIQAHVLIPQQLLQVLHNLMNPLMCCSVKRGINEAAVYIYEEKTYCVDCLKKLTDSLDPEPKAE